MTTTPTPNNNPLKLHHIIKPKKTLPQTTYHLNPSLPLHNNKILININILNINTTSFHQLHSTNLNLTKQIQTIISKHNKIHNPITNNNNILLNTIHKTNTKYPNTLTPNNHITTLISLTLTPLHLNTINTIHINQNQIKISNHTILFTTKLTNTLPKKLPQNIILTTLNITNTPTQIHHLIQPNITINLLNTNKTNTLTTTTTHHILNNSNQLIKFNISKKTLQHLTN